MASKRNGIIKDREADILDLVAPEMELVRVDAGVLQQFVVGLRAFFARARELETTARTNLATAKALVVPTSRTEDEAVQFFVKQVGDDKKEVLEHWEITTQAHSLHKRLVAARKRAEDPNEQAILCATRLHNVYTEGERLRVARENERLRLEAEDRARQERQEELRRLEAQAIEAEESSPSLSAREQKFVDLHCGPYPDPVRAAQQAGYKEYGVQAARLLSLPKIQQAILAKRKAATIREQKAAVAETPLSAKVETIQPDISTAAGHDRASHSAELLNERLLIEAVVGGQHGIPLDVLQVNPAKLNEYARSLRELITRWPGVRYVKKTSLV